MLGKAPGQRQNAAGLVIHTETLSPAIAEVSTSEIAVPVVPSDKGKGASHTESPVLEVSRKQLYDEIWELSALGVAKKYGIPYPYFLQQIKEFGIPVPPAGYWTKISYGKPVEKLSLSGDPKEILTLRIVPSPRKSAHNTSLKSEEGGNESFDVAPTDPNKETEQRSAESQGPVLEPPKEVETIERYGQIYNVYNRETLYQEVWKSPIIDLANRYKVSDTTIRKICRALDIPLPQQGYWAKLRAGKTVEKQPPLPKTKKDAPRIGPQTGFIYQPKQSREDSLTFLTEEDRIALMAVAAQIRIPDENERMHSKIIAHRKVIASWKKERKDISDIRYRSRYAEEPPYLASGISEDSIPRTCHILDALAKAAEPLGCKLKDNLTFIVSGEVIKLSFSEAKDKVEHVLTKEENRKLLEYQEERKRYKYASAPQIPKYDHPYNGRLILDISMGKSFRDSSVRLEERLGDILCEMYVAAENTKQERLKQEEIERQRQEEQRKREERRKRHDLEVDKTLALEHEAEDYDIACKIRSYIQARVAAHSEEDLTEWVEWATAKADWYDPTIAREDEFFGVRNHSETKDKKEPKRSYWY